MASNADQLYEQLLVLRAQMGDCNALEEIFLRYDAPLQYYVHRITGRPDRSEDIVQDVWLDVLRSITRLRNAGAFRTWLYRIARDKALYALRRSKQFPKLLGNTEMLIESEQDEEEHFSLDECASIHTCLDKLAFAHREVLSLHFLEAMTYESIASVTGCPIGTVKSRIYHAKRALRKEMEKMNNEKQ